MTPLSARIAEIVAIDPAAPALEFEGRWYTWGELGSTVDAVAALGRRPGTRGRHHPAQPTRARRAPCSACSAPAAASSRSTRSGGSSAPATTSPALDLDLVVGTRRRSRCVGRRPAERGARSLIDDLGEAPTVVGDRGARSRRRAGPSDVAVRMLTSGTTGPPKRIDLTYDTLERVLLGAKYYETDQAPADPAALRRRDRQLAAGAPRRAVPHPAVRQRRPVVRAARAVHGRRLVRRGPPPPTPDRRRWCPPRCGWCSKPTSTAPSSSSIRSVVSRHRAAVARRRRRLPRQVRHPGAHLVRRHRVRRPRRRAGTSPTTPSTGRPSGGASGVRHPGCELRIVDEDDGRVLDARRGRAARGEGRPARRRRAGGSAPPTWPASTPTASCGSSGAPTRRSSAAASRSGPTTSAPRSSPIPGVRGAAVIGIADDRLGAVPVAAVELRDTGGRASARRGAARPPRRRDSRPTSCPTADPDRRRAAPHRLGQGRPRRRPGTSSNRRRRARAELTVDLRYSDEDEAFRTEVRAWLEVEVPTHGPPPPPGDWPARRAYDTAWQRKLYDAGYAGLAWPADVRRPGPAGHPAARVPRGVRPGRRAVHQRQLRRHDARGPDADRRGHRRRSGAFHLPRILAGRATCGARASPSRRPAPTSRRCARGPTRDGDDYVVSGQKIWSTRAHVADYCELLVRTDPDAPKHKGITWLILDMRQPGVEVRPMRTIDGESHFCEVFLDEVAGPGGEPRRRRRTTAGGSPT